MRTVNGISGLATACCDFLEFIPDGNDNGFGGEFVASGVGYGTHGLFELNTSRDSINFTYGANKMTYGFRIEEEVFSFSYLDNDQKITETWIMEEQYKRQSHRSISCKAMI